MTSEQLSIISSRASSDHLDPICIHSMDPASTATSLLCMWPLCACRKHRCASNLVYPPHPLSCRMLPDTLYPNGRSLTGVPQPSIDSASALSRHALMSVCSHGLCSHLAGHTRQSVWHCPACYVSCTSRTLVRPSAVARPSTCPGSHTPCTGGASLLQPCSTRVSCSLCRTWIGGSTLCKSPGSVGYMSSNEHSTCLEGSTAPVREGAAAVVAASDTRA